MSAELPFNKLSPAEAERLDLLAEELAETIQAIGKIKRHGYDNYHPETRTPNRVSLEVELGHVLHAVERMATAGDIKRAHVVGAADEKAKSIGKWLHHQ